MERRTSVFSIDSNNSSSIYQTQQSVEMVEGSYDMQQDHFVKNSDLKTKSIKKFIKKEKKRKFSSQKSLDIKDLSFLGGIHNLNEITDKFADKLNKNEQEEERINELANKSSNNVSNL